MRTVLVTGAGSGIGRAAVEAFAAVGDHVVAAVRDPANCEVLDAPGIDVVTLDVSDASSITAALESAPDIDVLINNAGIADSGPIETIDWDVARRVFDVNLWGAVAVTRAVLPAMRQRGHGTIMNVSSVGGRTPARGFHGVYMASKHALRSISEALAWEVEPFGVRVLLAEPGFVSTNIFVRAGLELQVPPSPYAEQEAWVREFYLRGAERFAISPEVVARHLVAIVDDPASPLYNPIGDDARAGIEAALAASDFETWRADALNRVASVAGERPGSSPTSSQDQP